MRHRHIPIMVAVLALVLTACRPKNQLGARADSVATVSGGDVAAAPNAVTVHARDFAFVAPSQIPSGMTTFHFLNEGPGIHHMLIARLSEGKTVSDLMQAFRQPGPLPRWVELVGGPNAPAPGTESNATLDMTPGNYVMLCMVDVPGGVPHATRGMVRPFTVKPAMTRGAPAPIADVLLTLTDYRFALSKPLTAGSHTFEVRSSGSQPHEVELIQLAPGKTPQDMIAWIGKMQGPPPGRPMGGVAPMVPGSSAYFTATLAPGSYVLMCFYPDAKDGRPHFAHGMMQQFKVS